MDIIAQPHARSIKPITYRPARQRLPTFVHKPQWRSTTFFSGLFIVCMMVVIALIGEIIAPYDMAKMSADRLQAPSATHLFGTDLYGRDLFSRVLVGAKLSLTVAAAAVILAALPGIVLGVVAGMYPGLPSAIASYMVDAWMAVPALLLAIVLTTAFGRTTGVLAIALAIAGFPSYYRQARVETLTVNNRLYIEAARSLGANEFHIFLHHILPNVLSTLLVLASLRIGGMLIAVSAFSFIGLGAQPPEPEWGTLLAEGRDYLQDAWWLTFFPGCAIAFTVFGLNLLGDGVRDLLDPKMHKRK